MNRLLCTLIAALFALPAWAGEVFEHPATPAQAQALVNAAMPGVAQVQVLRGRYTQRKFLREIPRPLGSSGEFLLVRGQGIWWHTQVPMESELLLNRSKGQPPGLQMAASTFFAMFALDLDTLAQSFELFAMQDGPRWLLGLRPRDPALAAWFEQILLSGGTQLQQVTLLEKTGDRTEIDLDAVAQPLSSLTPIERKRFEP